MEPGRGASNDVPSLSLIFSSGVGADNETCPSRLTERLTWATTAGGPGPVHRTLTRNILPLSSLPRTRLHSCGQPKLGCGNSLRPGSPTEGKGSAVGLQQSKGESRTRKGRRRQEGSRPKAAVTQRPSTGRAAVSPLLSPALSPKAREDRDMFLL